MTVFAEALARGVQRHGAALALYTLRPTIYCTCSQCLWRRPGCATDR